MRIIVAAVLMLFVGLSAQAQSTPLPSNPPSSTRTKPNKADWGNLKQLTPNVEVFISLKGGRSVRGMFQSVTDDALMVNTPGQETLARALVTRVTFGRNHQGRNTLIGLAIGGAPGAALGAMLSPAREIYRAK